MNEHDAVWSRRMWRDVVWPELADQFPGYRYLSVEDRADDLAVILDCDGSIDALLICPGRPPMSLAARCQRIKPGQSPYDTYTLRVAKHSGLPTEIHKRWMAKCDPELVTATLTGQAYVDAEVETLLTAGVSLSATVTAAVPTKTRRILVNPADGTWFCAVRWGEVPLRAHYQPQLTIWS